MNRKMCKICWKSNVIGIIDASDCLCDICVHVLDNVAKLKGRIWNIICSAMKQRTALKFDKILQRFASVKMDQELDEEEESKAVKSTPPTSTSLLQYTHSEPCNEEMPDKIPSDQNQKTKQDDIAKTDKTSRRSRRRRRSRKSLWTRRRSKSSASVTSYASCMICDETDSSSVQSCRRVPRIPSCVTPASEVSDDNLSIEPRRTVEYDDVGRLVTKRTRSVSRAQEEEKQILERTEDAKHYCDEKNCEEYFMDIDVYNIHKTAFHNALALHVCQECKKRYTSAEHLQLHSLTHDNSSFFCLMCGVEMPNRVELQMHLDQHLDYSVLCKYCDKSFLSESACDQHCQVKHRKNRSRRLYRSKKLIIDRVDFKSLPSNMHQDSGYKVYMRNYITPVELDVNVNNLRMLNMDFYTEDDIRSVEVEAEEIEEGIQESYSELLTSSEMLEDVTYIRETCENLS